MSTPLNTAQIESFNTFAKNVKDWMDGETAGTSTARFFKERVAFGVLFKALIGPQDGSMGKEAGRLSKLAPVMNNVTNLEAKGRTKESFQLRYPEKTAKGEDHPQANALRFRVNGDAEMSDRHCVMYTKDAFRVMRSGVTGLKNGEPIYAVTWDAVPDWLQKSLTKKFPNKVGSKPEFSPLALGFLLRKGSKPKSGQKRHAWAGIDIVVGGKYGDQHTVITGTVKQCRPGQVARIADKLNLDCPDWGQDEPEATESEPEATYANVQQALLDNCGF